MSLLAEDKTKAWIEKDLSDMREYLMKIHNIDIDLALVHSIADRLIHEKISEVITARYQDFSISDLISLIEIVEDSAPNKNGKTRKAKGKRKKTGVH